MPRFFLHLRYRDEFIEDAQGVEFPDLAAAQADARVAARELLADRMEADSALSDQQFEICDEAGQLLATVPFRDALEPM